MRIIEALGNGVMEKQAELAFRTLLELTGKEA